MPTKTGTPQPKDEDLAALEAQAIADEDAAFDEFAQGESAPRASDNEMPDDEPEGDPQGDTPDDEPSAAASDNSDAESDTASLPDDLWKDATDAQRAAYEELQRQHARAEHAFASNRNRQSALQHKINALEADLKKANQQSASPSDGSADPGKTPEPAKATTDAGSDVDLTQFAEDFPEVYAAMNVVYQQAVDKKVGEVADRFNQQLTEVTSKLDTVSQPVSEMAEKNEAAYKASQLAALRTAHPDYEKVQNTQEFWSWLDTQPEATQALADSTAAEDNILLLSHYKSLHPSGDDSAQSSSQRLPRSADGATAMPSRGTTRPTGGVPDEEDAAFEYWASQAGN